MPEYRVEIETRGREVYIVSAPDEAYAREHWDEGSCVVQETTSVEDVTSVSLEED